MSDVKAEGDLECLYVGSGLLYPRASDVRYY